MRQVSSLIDTMRLLAPEMSRAERNVANIILSDIEAATRISTKSLAAQAEVSEPTVIRFARRMGCDGFTDFKIRLAQDYALGRMYIAAERQEPARTGRAVAEHVYEATAQALANAFSQRDPDALEHAVNILDKAQRVFCFGIGGSSANVAREAENRLFRLDMAASATCDSYQQLIMAANCGTADALLIFSVTGKPRSLVDSAEIARSQGGAVIAVTNPDSELAHHSNVVIPLYDFDEEKFFYMPNRGRYGQLYVLDCLATLLGARRMKSVSKKLWRARRILADLHGPTDPQPVGD
jgi:RpiR family transcriptional regulator, carbohydrate utilization regulator